jgi:hypothetical protein
MDGPNKQFLNADEVEAKPGILRHLDARQKRRNRSGQAAGISKSTYRAHSAGGWSRCKRAQPTGF